MPERREFDTPAIVLSCVVGVVLLSVFGVWSVFRYCDSPDASCTTAGGGGGALAFDVAWSQQPTSKTATITGTGTTTLDLNLTGLQGDSVVQFTSCTDTAQAPIQQPASVHWVLHNESGDQDQGTFSCPAPGPSTQTRGHPDIATVAASDQDSAAKALWSNPKIHNRTSTYTLTVTVTRANGGVPSPLPLPTDPTFSVSVRLSAALWNAHLTPAQKTEVGK